MSDSLSWCAEQEALVYEKKYGERDRQAGTKLNQLRSIPSGIFTIDEIDFLLNPFGKFYSKWTDHMVKRVNEIYERVIINENFIL